MLIELPVVWIIIVNVLAWLFFHLSVAYIATMLPAKHINSNAALFRERSWEKDGKMYDSVFRIKTWKNLLPDGSALFKKGFRKKRLLSVDKEYVTRFIVEVCRAEAAHWIVILLSPVFFLWNDWWAGIIMILYALAANLPCILAQRYNRIRFRSLLNRFVE